MMRMKNVQKIILDSMSQLSSIICQEILSIEKIHSTSSKIPQKNSKLLTLAEDIKNVMNNYVFIQGKVSDMREIINSFDAHIETPQENSENSPIFTSAFNFLSSIPPSQIMTNSEIEEISNELWSKQMDVESMLKVEIDKLKEFQSTIASRYHYKYEFLKARAGIKIKAIEEEREKMVEGFHEQINRQKMMNEEYLGVEYEKVLNEEKRISKIFDPRGIRDLNDAITKIKELLSIKLIYEKKRNKDEKLIKGLNSKLKILLENYSALLENHSKLESKFEELKTNHDSLAESTSLSPKNKEKFKMLKQESVKLELTRPETIFSEFPPRKVEATIDTKALSIKTKNESIKIFKTEAKIDKNRRLSPRKKLKTAPPAARTPFQPILTQEQAIQDFQQALISIDEGFQKTNKALAEDLEELVNYQVDFELQQESKELLSRIAKGINKSNTKTLETVIDAPEAEPVIEELVFSPVTEINPLVKQDKELQVTFDSFENCETQTTSKLYSKIEYLWFKFKDHKFSEDEFENLVLKGIEKNFCGTNEICTQTEKEIVAPIELQMTENLLIKGLMNRARRISLLKPEESVQKENSIIEKIIKIPVFSETKFEKLKENKINELYEATNQYKEEFLIQSQLKGYKRVELQNKEMIWEDIINRRIAGGEEDKISIYLRGLLGTDIFESEKANVIQMIEGNKIQGFSANQMFSLRQIRIQRARKNWKKLMSLFITQHISYFMESLSTNQSPSDQLFQAAKKIKFVKHRLKHHSPDPETKKPMLDEFGFNRSERWKLRSLTPALHDNNRVKSRYLNTRNVKTLHRIKKPSKKVIQYRTIDLSPLHH